MNRDEMVCNTLFTRSEGLKAVQLVFYFCKIQWLVRHPDVAVDLIYTSHRSVWNRGCPDYRILT